MDNLPSRLQYIYDILDNVETLITTTSIEEVEKNFIILMGLFEVELGENGNAPESSLDSWCAPFTSNVELAFHKREFFSEAFVKYYEIWYHRDDNPVRIVIGSSLNQFCLSNSVYEKIKRNKDIFVNFWEGDFTDLWESEVFLFERYDRQSFSNERYHRLLG